MTELRDGYLYHPDGGTETDQLKRLIAGEYNLAFDDLFSTTLKEAEDAVSKAEKEHLAAVERLRALEAKVSEMKEQKARVENAIRHFKDTGEVTDVLYPSCDRLLAAERMEFASADADPKKKQIEDAKAALDEELGADWDVADAHADDEFVYVTVKRRRAAPPRVERPKRDTLIEKVKQAFDTHALAFKDRVQPTRLANVTVGRPRAP